MRQSLLSIRAKLFAGFGFTLLLMVVVGVLGIVEVSAVGNNGDTIGRNSLPSVVDVKTVDGLTMLVGQAARAFELFFGAAAPAPDETLRGRLTTDGRDSA